MDDVTGETVIDAVCVTAVLSGGLVGVPAPTANVAVSVCAPSLRNTTVQLIVDPVAFAAKLFASVEQAAPMVVPATESVKYRVVEADVC